MTTIFRIFAAFSVAALPISAAAQDWQLIVQPPNVFGTTRVVAWTTAYDRIDHLQVICDDKTPPKIHVLEDMSDPKDVTAQGIRLILRGAGDPVSAVGDSEWWNNTTYSMVEIADPDTVQAMLDVIARAPGRVDGGLVLPNGDQYPMTFPSDNGAAAVAQIRSHCPTR